MSVIWSVILFSSVVASVIPLQRLPKQLAFFDYAVPENMAGVLRPGQLVAVPFRSRPQLGIILELRDGEDASLKSIENILHEAPILPGVQMSILPILAAWYGVSLSVVARLMLPPLQKKKLRDMKLAPLSAQEKKKPSLPLYQYYTNEEDHAAFLREGATGTALILQPTMEHLERARSLLPKDALVWHGELSEKEKFSAWRAVRNGEARVILGTRSAVFLPFPALDRVIVDAEHDENHKSWDSAPRYHAKDLAALLAERFGAALHLASFSPSVDAYHAIFAGEYRQANTEETPKKTERLFVSPAMLPKVIDMRDERKKKNYSLFADGTADAILSATGDVFLFLNRIGFATSVGCNDCGNILRCPSCRLPFVYEEAIRSLVCHYCGVREPFPLSCPVCASPVVQLRGAGTELAERDVRRLLGDAPRDIVRIDSTSPQRLQADSGKPRVIVGTEMAFPAVRWDKTSLSVFLDIDKQMALPEFRAVERAWHLIEETRYRLPTDGQLIIQTFNPDHHLFRSLKEPDRLYRTELSTRKTLGYPPYAYLTRAILGKASETDAAREAAELAKAVSALLTEAKKPIILHPPIETHPKRLRGLYSHVLVARLEIHRWQEDLPWLNAQFPDEWKIDPNPLSLLAP